MKTSNLKKGSILSETSFYVVEGFEGAAIVVVTDNGQKVRISNQYVENVLSSADSFEKEEQKTMTELADLFIGSPRVAMTVAFFKKDTAKTKKVYEAEKSAVIERIQNAKISEVPALLNDLIENPLSKMIPGELRVMKGRHYGNVDELGRIQFTDMELTKEAGKDYDSRLRQVDPRTIQYIIVGDVKYSLKK